MQGVSYKPLSMILAVAPGLALVPAAISAIQLHRTSIPEQVSRLWVRSLALAAVGLIIMTASALYLHSKGQQ